MTWDLVWEVAGKYGLPLAGALALVWALVKGTLRPQREFDQAEKGKDQMQRDFERQIATLIADWQQRETALTKDRDFYRSKSWELMDRWAGDLDQAEETAASVAARVSGRKR